MVIMVFILAAVGHLPKCWAGGLGKEHLSKNKWIIADKGLIGCQVCKLVGSMPESHKAGSGVRVSKQWSDCNVGPYGDTHEKQLSSLRKKVWEHARSTSHDVCSKIVDTQKKDQLPSALNKCTARAVETTTRCFITAYKVAKSGQPFTDYPDEIALQELNKVDLGRVLHSNVVCKDIISHISEQMKRQLLSSVVKSGSKVSILLDESTSLSKKSCLIVYLRAVIGCKPLTFFLDLVELDSGSALSIKLTLLKILDKHGLNEEYLRLHLLSIATDGCSVMLGKTNGLVALLRQSFPKLISWHCSAHRLELMVNDALKATTATNHFQSFMDKIYCTYSQSPKNQRELEEIAKDLNEQLLKIGKVFSIRWIASSARTVKAVWRSYSSLHAHFSEMFPGLATTLASEAFIKNLGLMLDVLTELQGLSEELQARDLSVPEAHQKMLLQRQALAGLKQTPGQYESVCLEGVADGVFKGISTLKNVRGTHLIIREQFIQALLDSMDQRMFTDSELVESLRILDHATWPADFSEVPSFADEAVRKLNDSLEIRDMQLHRKFREYVSSGGKKKELIKELLDAVAIIPTNSAECERGFHSMNLLMTSLRTSLQIPTLSNQLFLYTTGPPLRLFKPQVYVESWIKKGRNTATETSSMMKRPEDFTSQYLYPVWSLL